ncbi:hypothetical protein F511_14166 [Dorcoceras hygrometricum]|uniref:Dystroglycan-like n=1 Tax=Dorcoceras hygrometricum TaxID=472368 RepID=A0A2Z7CTV7_9LAMI|nr:hypothetical protein F511_14166 [Dorcoceras hygrometricum]
MASAFITNALQVNFDYVLGISYNNEMVNMFKALEPTGLRGFLGCSSVLHEQELEKFFDTALVQDGAITCVVSGKYVAIPEDKFAGIFNLPTEGLTDLSEVPNNLVLQARTLFSKSSVPVQFSCKKRLMKYEFRLLNDILAKSVTVKVGSFDAVTHERFLMMTSIHFGIKVNWSKILFEVLKEMVDRTTKRAKGFAAQICVLLKRDPAVTLGEAKTFPPLKILFAKTVNTYVAMNKTIDAHGETDEPEVAKVAIVKKKSVSSKRSISTAIKDTTERDLGLVSVASEAVPIQMIEPISVVPAERPPAPKRKALKRKFRMPAAPSFENIHSLVNGDPKPVVPRSRVYNVGNSQISILSKPGMYDYKAYGSSCDIGVKWQFIGEHAEPLGSLGLSGAGDDPADEYIPTGDVTESLSQLRASNTRLSVNQLKTSSKIGDLQNNLLFKIENLEKAFKEALANQELVYRNLMQSARQEAKFQQTALSLELLEFKKGVGEQNAVLISDVTDIRSQTKEIQALKTDFTDFQQKTESGIAHVSLLLEMVVVVVAEVSLHEKEEALDLSREIGDIG